MANYRVVLSELPPVGSVIEEGGQHYEVISARPHVSRDGRATGVIRWRSACRTCGVRIEQETGFLIRSFNRNCAEHGFWTKRLAAPREVEGPGPRFVHDAVRDGVQHTRPAAAVAPETSARIVGCVLTRSGLLDCVILAGRVEMPFRYSEGMTAEEAFDGEEPEKVAAFRLAEPLMRAKLAELKAESLF